MEPFLHVLFITLFMDKYRFIPFFCIPFFIPLLYSFVIPFLHTVVYTVCTYRCYTVLYRCYTVVYTVVILFVYRQETLFIPLLHRLLYRCYTVLYTVFYTVFIPFVYTVFLPLCIPFKYRCSYRCLYGFV